MANHRSLPSGFRRVRHNDMRVAIPGVLLRNRDWGFDAGLPQEVVAPQDFRKDMSKPDMARETCRIQLDCVASLRVTLG